MRARTTQVLFVAAVLFGGPAAAEDDISDWNVDPLRVEIGNASFRLGGDASGSVFLDQQPAFPGLDKAGGTGALRLFPSLERDYDSGLSLAFRASLLPWHDRLANDRYGGKTFEKAYLSVQTGLGSIELGDTDGAGYRLAVAGPKVDEKVSIDDPEMTFFRDPTTHRAFDEIFTIRTEVGSSFNDAKLSYYSPRLFGVQLATSFSPSEGKDVLPFVTDGPHVANRERNIWEVAASYSQTFDQLSLGASAAVSMGHNAAKTPGHHGLTDWALGVAADYDIDDDTKVSLGGAWRQTNAYAFNVNDVLASGETRALHASASVTRDRWVAGFELVDGTADGSLGTPTLTLHGYQASVAYVFNTNLQLTLGWQRLRYARSSGLFYDGAPAIGMNAEYLHLDFHV